jgi:choline monooxygenase
MGQHDLKSIAMTNSFPEEVLRLRRRLSQLRGASPDTATAMPSEFYTSSAFLAAEQDDLFRQQWVGVGHMGEIPAPGDYFTTELVGEQLLVLRGSDGETRTLSNVCRHRGNVVARNRGRARRFTCPYHAWTYDLGGALIGAPFMDSLGGFDKSTCRLPVLKTETWQGFIFVNLDGNATPLAPQLEAIEPFIHNYRPAERHLLFWEDDVWNTNWKCLVENFMEGYHLSPTHAKTLHAVTPTALCEKLPHGAAYTGYRANFDPSCPERGPYTPTLTAQERRSDVFYCIYPSFVVGFCPHFTLYMCLRPRGVGQVALRWGITGVADDPGSPVVKDYIQLCRDFSREDRVELETLFLGLQSHYYSPGRLAPDAFEGTIYDLIQYIARRMGA